MAGKSVSERLQHSIIVYSALGILVIGVIVALVSIMPLFNRLKKDQDRDLLFAVKTRTMAVEEYLLRAKDIALQITSRTKAREKLESYNKGEVTLDEFVNFSEGILMDALKKSKEVEGISRLDRKGNLVVQVGLPIPEELWQVPDGESREVLIHGPVTLRSESYLIVGAPILDRQSVRVGTDIVLFKLTRLQQIVEDYTGLGETGEAVLGAARDDRVELFCPLRGSKGGAPESIPKDSPLGSAFEKALHKEAGILKSSDSPEVIAYSPIRGSEWGIVVKMNKEELYAYVNRQIVVIGSILFVLILLGTSGMVVLLRPLAGKMIIHTGELRQEIREKTAALETELNERKGAEETLRQSEEKYRELVNTSVDGVISVDPQMKIVLWNRGAETIFGYTDEEMLGQSLMKIVPERYRKAKEKGFVEFQKSGSGPVVGKTLELEGVRKDGTEIPVEFTVSSRRVGETYIATAIVRDITERKRAEEALKKERSELQKWINTFDTFVAKFDPNGVMIFCNEAPIKAGGLTKGDVDGTYFPDTKWWSHSEVERARIVECFERAKAGLASRIETNFRSADGTPVPIIFNCQPVMDGDGKVKYITAEGKVIVEEARLRTELQEAKEALEVRVRERTSELLEAIKKLAKEIAEHKRAEEQILRQSAISQAINRVFQETLTCETEEEVARTCLAVAEELTGSKFGWIGEVNQAGRLDTIALSDPGWDACRIPESNAVVMIKDIEIRGIWGRVLKDGKSMVVNDPSSHPDRVRTPEGHPLLTSFLGVPLKRAGRAIGMIALANKESGYDLDNQQDVEALSVAFVEALMRKRAEEALRKAHDELEARVAERTEELAQANIQLKEMDRLKSEFLATMSHELRTPLNSIIGFTGIMLQGIPGKLNEEQRKQLSMVYNSAKHLLILINDILDISRVESGRMEISTERFKIQDVVSEGTQSLSPMISQKGLRLVTEIPDETPEIYSDRKKVLQILLNLVNNAVKFTQAGEVRIGGKFDNDNLEVSVSDTGIGIKEEDMKLLFEAFRQMDGTARRRYQGAGLGLYLCQKLVTLLGGNIWAESEYGRGSKFTFTLPLRRQERRIT